MFAPLAILDSGGELAARTYKLRCILWFLLVTSMGCNSSSSNTTVDHVKPATVEKLPLETELATITLSPDAVRRLGIETQKVLKRKVMPRRTLGGEAIIPNGNLLIVTAPVSGIVSTPPQSAIPQPGATVKPGEIVLSLIPLLSPERAVLTPAERVQLIGARANLIAAQTTAQGDVERSQAEVEAVKITLARSEKLFQDRAGPRRAVEDAQAQLHVSESVLQAAIEREQQLARMLEMLKTETSDGEADPLPMTAPIGGIVNRVSVSQGQTVAANAALFDIVNLDTIWIRVPVFVDLLSTIQKDQNASLVSLGGDRLGLNTQGSSQPTYVPVEARPIVAPPSADAQTSSADLYYEVDNHSLGLRPGQRVGVELPLAGASEAIVVPAASIVYDVYGGTWVYVVSGEQQYTRQRVSLRWIDEDDAILESGPAPDSQVVVTGVAELFGTEFGTGK